MASQSQLVAWQWPYSAFGDAPPTLGADRHVNPLTTPNAGTHTMARVEFNLRLVNRGQIPIQRVSNLLL